MKLKEPRQVRPEESDLLKEAHRAIEENGIMNDEEDDEELDELNIQLHFLNDMHPGRFAEADMDDDMSSEDADEEEDYCPTLPPQGIADLEHQEHMSPFGCGSDRCPVCSRL
ncbi:hypothetical protein KR038_000601 [Drosophila bunnanda]|nr:hypothetical protein KR038_000601 [Drosophila bunnanda]